MLNGFLSPCILSHDCAKKLKTNTWQFSESKLNMIIFLIRSEFFLLR